jgi:hypothetical protein
MKLLNQQHQFKTLYFCQIAKLFELQTDEKTINRFTRSFFLCSIFLFIFGSKISAQEKCGTQFNRDKLIEMYPEFNSIYHSQDQEFVDTSFLKQSTIITIPVIFHVIYNDPSQQVSATLLNQAVDILSKDFRRQNPDAVNTGQYGGYESPTGLWSQNYANIAADCEIQFIYCGVTYDYTPYAQIDISQNPYYLKTTFPYYQTYNPAKFLNVWVCNMGGSLLGLAEFPGSPPQYDGVTITHTSIGYNSADNRVLTHEVGHWLGLRHIWGDCMCCDDYVGDTAPQQDNNSAMANQPSFPSYPNQYPCATWTACPGVNVYGNLYYPYVNMGDNFMDYSPSSCLNFFSQGQKQRMWYFINNYRPTLLQNNSCTVELIEETQIVNSIKVYPNPTNGILKLSENANVQLIDLTGKVILNESNVNSLDLNQQKNGVYILMLTNDSGALIQRMKIVKE